MASKGKSYEKEFDEEFDWVRIKTEIDQSQAADVGLKRLSRLMLMNPFVPVGVVSTCAALVLGLKNFYRSDHRKQQLFMRARVGAQGFTVLALVGGVFYEAMKY